MKSDFINCKNCTDDCHCKGKDITPICLSFKPAKITNADGFRSVTDYELSQFLSNVCACLYDDADVCKKWNGACDKCWLDWLKQEVSDGD